MGKKTKKSTKKFQHKHKKNAGTGSHMKKHASTKRVKAAVQPGAAGARCRMALSMLHDCFFFCSAGHPVEGA